MPHILHHLPRPAGYCPRVLGLTISQAPTQATSFSVPAHALATLNVVLNGTLAHAQQKLPTSFATGCHTRSRRYTISPGATLLTLFCSADILEDISGRSAAHFTDTWHPTALIFKAWHACSAFSLHDQTPLAMAKMMFDCVAPSHLPLHNQPRAIRYARRLHMALHVLAEHPLATAAAQLHTSERTLQRLFMSQWGISPKHVQRLLRIQRCITLWDTQPKSLADLATHVGLVDQAHLAREFRQLVGHPPRSMKSPHHPTLSSTDTLWALRAGSTLLKQLMHAS